MFCQYRYPAAESVATSRKTRIAVQGDFLAEDSGGLEKSILAGSGMRDVIISSILVGFHILLIIIHIHDDLLSLALDDLASDAATEGSDSALERTDTGIVP